MLIALTVILAIACAALGVAFEKATEDGEALKATMLKGLTTVCCIGIAAVALFNTSNLFFATMVIIGVFFGFVGDELIAMRFVFPEKHTLFFGSGAAAFFVGHVFYIIALYSIAPKAWIVALPLLIVVVAGEYIGKKKFGLDLGKMFVPLGGYAAFVCFMACTAVGACVFSFSLGTFMFAIGGVCFAVSDAILGIQCFGGHPDSIKSRALHIFYWAAQLLIAISPMFLTVAA